MNDENKIKMSFYDTALDFVSRQAKENVIDAILCEFHNEGYSLEGNTAAADVAWFAEILYSKHHDFGRKFRDLSDGEKQCWIERAQDALDCLPSLMSRMANRMIRISQALKTISQEQRRLKEIKKSTK